MKALSDLMNVCKKGRDVLVINLHINRIVIGLNSQVYCKNEYAISVPNSLKLSPARRMSYTQIISRLEVTP